MKSPYEIIHHRYVTEKAIQLSRLTENVNTPVRNRAKSPKAVFLVSPKADKIEIARAIEQIYAERGVKVTAVNTINAKPKACRVRGRKGVKSGFKKAIVTFRPGDVLDELINS